MNTYLLWYVPQQVRVHRPMNGGAVLVHPLGHRRRTSTQRMTVYSPFVCLSLLVLLLTGCGPSTPTLFSRVDAAESGITFENTLTETPELNVMRYEYLYNGGGVAAADFNNDGRCDLYFTGNAVPNKMYLNQTQPARTDQKAGPLRFKDVTGDAHVAGRSLWKTGVTVADVNADGWLDIYVCYSGPVPASQRANELYINNGCSAATADDSEAPVPTFTERAIEYGLDAPGTLSTHASFFDYDRDGDLDMFLLNHGDRFYGPFFNTRKLRALRHPQFGNRLYRNDGGQGSSPRFTEVSDAAGIHGGGLNFGLSVSVGDVNGDNWPDLYVTNDYEEQDFFYLNNQNGTFSEITKQVMGHISRYGMGSDIADINNDGRPDVVVMDMLPEDNHRQKMLRGPDEYQKYQLMVDSGYHHQAMRNTLQLNMGKPPGTGSAAGPPVVFSEIGQLAGVSNTDWSWAALLADYDNDGYKDLYVTNGYLRDFTNMDFLKFTVAEAKEKAQVSGTELPMYELIAKMPSTKVGNYMYQNAGPVTHALTFKNRTTDWGLNQPDMSFGATYADLDNDGDLDLVTNNTNEVASVWQNNSDQVLTNNYLKIKLNGAGKNRNGIGAQVTLTLPDGRQQLQQVSLSRGYQSSVEPVLCFGLGQQTSVKNLTVLWPDGRVSQQTNVRANQLLMVNQTEARQASQPAPEPGTSLFADVSAESGVDFVQRENKFVDFQDEPLVPYQASRLGPHLSAGDVNGDSLDDFYVGGPAGQSGRLFLQTSAGRFKPAPAQPWAVDAASEDLGSVFFDADRDGDLDLYVVSGGNEFPLGSPQLQDRLYLNQGRAGFVKAPPGSIPAEAASGGCVAAADYDHDGDTDLFVGGRIKPGQYPLSSPGGILRNDTDAKTGQVRFSVATPAVNPALRDLGLVTDACWTDVDRDGWADLVVVGEWMPLRVFMNRRGRLEPASTQGLDNTTGLWAKVLADDLDNDGDVDFVLGNYGLNSQWRASAGEPLTLHYGDFENKGRVDPIISNYVQGRTYPVASRDELLQQLNSARKKFTTYASYADATLADVLGLDSLKNAQTRSVQTLQSVYVENQGQGRYVVRPLPIAAQVSMVCGLATGDFDHDGRKDILVAGNFYPMRVQQGRADASAGVLLRGNGRGTFTAVGIDRSGFYAPGDVRDLLRLRAGKGRSVLVLSKNSDRVQVVAETPPTYPMR